MYDGENRDRTRMPANNKEKHQCASSTKKNDREEVGPPRQTGMRDEESERGR